MLFDGDGFHAALSSEWMDDVFLLDRSLNMGEKCGKQIFFIRSI
jgi:hypothetical protein